MTRAKPKTDAEAEVAEGDAPERMPQFGGRLRLKSERSPYRRGGYSFAAARQWFEFNDDEAKEMFTREQFRKLAADPVVVVQISVDGGKTWETVPPPPADDDDDDQD